MLVVRSLPDKSCGLDPLPTRFLEAIIDVVAPFLTELFNRSLSTGDVRDVFKSAYIMPLLKQANMNPADVRS